MWNMRLFSATTILCATLACSSSPTAPTPVGTTSIQPVGVVTPPASPVIPPAPAGNPLLRDPRFSLSFYRQLVRNAYDAPNSLQVLKRQTAPPRVYLRTIDDQNRTIDAQTLEETAAALIAVTGSLTGVFGLAGLERGTDSRLGVPGWITVFWHSAAGMGQHCADALIGGNLVNIYYRVGGTCRCSGGGAIKPLIVKHEMGHALGFYHTDSVSDLMHNGGHTTCDLEPSEREKFHAALAYTQVIGSGDPQ